MKNPKILDIECYVDYFLLSFKCAQTGKFREFELYENRPIDLSSIRKIMQSYTTISFNGNSYDLPMICALLKGYTNQQLKKLSDKLILSDSPSWMTCRDLGLRVPQHWDHVDLIEVAPGKASLKIYGGRLHSHKLQDLPIEPSANISPSQRETLRLYCRNDLDTTQDLMMSLSKQIKLREDMSDQYGVDLRSKSDAQIAEAVLKHELDAIGVNVRKNPVPSGTEFKYTPPEFISFKTEQLNTVLHAVKHAVFVVQDSGQVKMPPELNKSIEFHGAKYQMGIGGLHSQEKNQVIKCGAGERLYEADFASFYPFIILGESFYPEHLGKGFLNTYRSIVERRISAKHSGDSVTADSLKITINGSFGKLGSKYSALYSPNLLIQTTVTGQLCLLMLIEAVHLAGGRVVSANTDGVVIHCKDSAYSPISDALFYFELLSGYTLEETHYKAIYSRDVNNYVAIKRSGVKGKGAFAEPNLMKNPTAEICVMAVKDYLSSGKSIEQTIRECTDVRRFICIRSVTGGAIWREDYLGKAVRFYYSTDGDVITYKKNGNKVPKSDGAKPLMQLPDVMPTDIDLSWYVNESRAMLKDLGC